MRNYGSFGSRELNNTDHTFYKMSAIAKTKKILCSVHILTLNSADILAEALESVKDFEEIIVLDGNSTDGTQEIARAHGAKVYPQKETEEKNVRINNFTEVKLRAISLTTFPWTFELDSDEQASGELVEEIRSIVADPNADTKTGYAVPRKALIDGKVIDHAFFYPDLFVRLYHKTSGITFKPKIVHEQLFIPESVTIKQTNGWVYAPSPSFKEGIAKDDYYLSLVAKNYEKAEKNFRKTLKSALINIAKAGNIVLKVSGIYIRHGFSGTLPLKYNWRFVRYHLLISKLRVQQLFSLFLLSSCGEK